jgi:hypothetical protein
MAVSLTESAMQMAHSALDAVVAFLNCSHGMHTISRTCCISLCKAGIAQPLVALLDSSPAGHRCTEVCALPAWWFVLTFFWRTACRHNSMYLLKTCVHTMYF